jgi:DNA-binding transcriptional MerR regulator
MVASLFKHEVYSCYRVKRMNSNERFSIGELSKATGVKVVTIRYYEHVKLMPEPARTEGNYRIYSREHLHRLQFVRRCRDLGFTLDQLRDLLGLSVQAAEVFGHRSHHRESLKGNRSQNRRSGTACGAVTAHQKRLSRKRSHCRLSHSRRAIAV